MKNFIIVAILAISFQASGYHSTTKPSAANTEKNVAPAFFQFIRGHKQGNSAYSLQWKMSNNSGIVQFEIQSTYEDPYDPYSNWTDVGIVNNFNPGICKFTDPTVLPGIISYRIIAVYNNRAENIISEIFMATIE